MFVSVALWGHAQPLLRMAEEMANRGYRISFATHNQGKEWIAQGPRTSGMEFFSAGDFPIPDLRSKLEKITKDASNFRSILALFNEVYLPLVEPMYNELYPQLLQKNNRPDVMVIDIGTLGALHLAHKLDIKYVINSPTLHFQLGKQLQGTETAKRIFFFVCE
jgi:UDP:flavonoid glycosyltransferase YjiC (YdhE family)